MKVHQICNTTGKRGIRSILALIAVMVSGIAFAGVIDDAKFILDLRGDPNNNAYIDSGEAGNALDLSASAVYGGGNGNSSISASQYATSGTAKYGTLPYVSSVSVVNPYDGSTSSRQCLVLPQDKKTENSKTYWAENGIVLPNSAVPFGSDGYVTIYSRFKWDGNTSSPNLLVGNGWDGIYGNADHGFSVFLNGNGNVGILNNNAMPKCSAQVAANSWYDLFVVAHNETIAGAEKVIANVYLYKSNAGASPTLTSSVITNNPATFTASKSRLVIGCFLVNSTGWLNISNPRAFKGTIADVMLWDRAVTSAEMAEVMRGTPDGGEWQIGALNNSADEFNDTDPVSAFEPQTMA